MPHAVILRWDLLPHLRMCANESASCCCTLLTTTSESNAAYAASSSQHAQPSIGALRNGGSACSYTPAGCGTPPQNPDMCKQAPACLPGADVAGWGTTGRLAAGRRAHASCAPLPAAWSFADLSHFLRSTQCKVRHCTRNGATTSKEQARRRFRVACDQCDLECVIMLSSVGRHPSAHSNIPAGLGQTRILVSRICINRSAR